jgi:molybdopterin synthase catalytic subunit
MQVRVLLFATLKDMAGKPRLTLTLPLSSANVTDVRHALMAQFPAMKANLEAAISAVNEEYAFPEDAVHDGDEVAFFPPVSGGGTNVFPEIYQLATQPIDANELIKGITIPATGAVCIFSGMVRGETSTFAETMRTLYLEYEAYQPMALAKMRQVSAEIRERWPLVQGIAIVQRVGKLEVGENTILIACSSGHRDQGCFEAARYGIDRLKEIVPVWKKEVQPDGHSWVEGHYLPTPNDRKP